MKIIFLDIDGVLIKFDHNLHRWQWDFDHELVKNFIHLLFETNANIVISSSWRHHMESLKDLFYKWDIPWDRVISKTWHNTDGWRSTEILKWLDDHHRTCGTWDHVTHWCAIDDEYYEMKAIKRLGKLVKTEVHTWLTKEKVEEVILLLT